MKDMPVDPFNSGVPDLTQWAANFRGMYTSLIAVGFNEAESLEITVKMMQVFMGNVK